MGCMRRATTGAHISTKDGVADGERARVPVGLVQRRLERLSLLLYGREQERPLQDGGHEIGQAGRIRGLPQPRSGPNPRRHGGAFAP